MAQPRWGHTWVPDTFTLHHYKKPLGWATEPSYGFWETKVIMSVAREALTPGLLCDRVTKTDSTIPGGEMGTGPLLDYPWTTSPEGLSLTPLLLPWAIVGDPLSS